LHRYLPREGLLFLEDLGDTTLESIVVSGPPERRRQSYQLAVDTLLDLQRYTAVADSACIAYRRAFDYDLLLWELRHFQEWLLENDRGARLEPAETEIMGGAFDSIARRLADQPTRFVHRDFQSRNLMVQENGAGTRLRVIDFQDALLGTIVYDLVALLRDSYVELEPELMDELIARHAKGVGMEVGDSRRLFDLQTVQRKLKDAGRFIYIDRVKKNPGFLVSIPASLRYVKGALERLPELTPLRKILARHVPELS
jgi:aminoglycoside/choline kinase family phosphotransferase